MTDHVHVNAMTTQDPTMPKESVPSNRYPEEFSRPGDTDMPERGLSGKTVLTSKEWWAVARAMKLSDREFQIVEGVFDDKKESQIAEELQISAHTVHTYLGRLYRKLGVSSRAQLIVRVFSEYVRHRDQSV